MVQIQVRYFHLAFKQVFFDVPLLRSLQLKSRNFYADVEKETKKELDGSSLKTKSNKQINNSNSTKPSVTPNSTQSNLSGKVDLDDEEDLLTKYQSKKNSK